MMEEQQPYLIMLPKKVSPSSLLTQISDSYLIKNVINLAIAPYWIQSVFWAEAIIIASFDWVFIDFLSFTYNSGRWG